jgi:ribosome biogenesis GTPase
LTAARAAHPEPEAGCVLAVGTGLLIVLTDHGTVRATYGPRVLGEIARDRSRAPAPGEWVTLRRWPDGPVTVEATHGPRVARPLADVLPLRPSA